MRDVDDLHIKELGMRILFSPALLLSFLLSIALLCIETFAQDDAADFQKARRIPERSARFNALDIGQPEKGLAYALEYLTLRLRGSLQIGEFTLTQHLRLSTGRLMVIKQRADEKARRSLTPKLGCSTREEIQRKRSRHSKMP